METVIRVDNLHKVYDTGEIRVHALRGVSLSIEPGEFVAIMGTSGSGKSTMMNILGCLDRPTKGHYYLDGVDVSNFTKDERANLVYAVKIRVKNDGLLKIGMYADVKF